MIYQELHHCMITRLSSTEIDTCLYALTKTDWDSRVHASVDDLSKHVGTTKKYMFDIIKRLTSPIRGKKVFTKEGDVLVFRGQNSSVHFNPFTDRYGKKYAFFYTPDFKTLSLNAKRLLLIASFEMSITKSEKVVLKKKRLLRGSGILPLNHIQLTSVLEELNGIMGNIVSVGITSNFFTREEEIVFQFHKGVLSNYVSNYTERFLVRKKLHENGVREFVSDEVCIGIEKVGKSLYNKLLREEKAYRKRHHFDEERRIAVLKLARFIYDASLTKFAKQYHRFIQQAPNRDKVAAYFSKIVHETTKEETAKASLQAANIEHLLNHFLQKHSFSNIEDAIHENKEFFDKKRRYEAIEQILLCVCEDWMNSRFKGAYEHTKEKRRKNKSKQTLQEVETYLEELVYQEELSTLQLINDWKQVAKNTIGFHSIKEAFEYYFVRLRTNITTLSFLS